METIIDGNGLHIKFLLKFFHLKMRYKYFPWTEISVVQIKRYNIAQYVFYGLQPYIMSKNMGLHFISKNKKKLFLSTNDPVTLAIALKKWGN
jgi:hypothetical protein